MKSLISLCLVAGSALIASRTFIPSADKIATDSAGYFTCNINGKSFSSLVTDSSLQAIFTYTDNRRFAPAALFINAETQEGNNKSSFYIQPVNDDAPAVPLTEHNNLYNSFYITYKAADNSFYNTATAPGNFEITAIDTAHKTVTGKLNCILYSSVKKQWLIVTNGRFKLKF